jgi:flagellar motor protein MotB
MDLKLLRRKTSNEEENWIVAYADLMTLLFIFLVMLLSMSTFDQRKFNFISKFISKDAKTPLATLKNEFENTIGFLALGEQVKVDLIAEGLKIQFADYLIFKNNSTELTKKGEEILLKLFLDFQRLPGNFKMSIISYSKLSSKKKSSLEFFRSQNIFKFFHLIGLDGSKVYLSMKDIKQARSSLSKHEVVIH